MSSEVYQVRTSMDQEEKIRKQAKKNVEIARLNILHTFLVGKIALNCILRSNFLVKTSAEVDFQGNKLHLCQRDKTKTIPLR